MARVLLTLGIGLAPVAGHAADDVTIGYIGSTAENAWRGAQLGISEANVLGRFIGAEFRLEILKDDSASSATKGIAVVADVDSTKLVELSASLGVPILNVRADDDALRLACHAHVFHVAPSARMRRDARDQWLQKHPGVPVEARAWSSAFTKYAARELNSRYRKAHAVPMDDAAWAGWAAVRLLAEAVARAGADPPGGLEGYLRSELSFDGQKGISLSFRPTGQLRQPLLLVSEGRLVGEAPVRGVVGVEDLDSLGASACAAGEEAS